ncbi:hypothetical protein BURK2_02544 [Burkholderiales bacterium]|nr:hypothetical protein BURK2_02544 [Burkholderiales bacterium]
MMISITIGLLILSAMTTLFVNQSRTRAELDKSNRMIDNGRYAMDLLSDNLKLAGFYGALDPSSIALPGALPDPCSTNMASINAAIPLHVQGFDAANTGTAVAPPPTCVPSSIKNGSDILVIRRADTSGPVAQTAAVNGTPYLQASLCQYDTTTTYLVDNTPANLTLRQRNCTPTSTTPYAELRRMLVHIYYIDQNNQAGDGIPTLKRVELSEAGAMTSVALVEGIEFMQIDYGLDTNSDGAADSYTTCSACTITDWSNVVSVKITLLSRNLETSAGYSDTKTYTLGLAGTHTPAAGDNYKRHTYAQTIRLVNPSSRRETP